MAISLKMSMVLKLIDFYSGMPIENATVKIVRSNYKFLDKGDGFYIAVNLPEKEYKVNIQAKGYSEQNIDICVANDSGERIKVVPVFSESTYGIKYCVIDGKIMNGRKKVSDSQFYYGVDDKNFKFRVSSDTKKGYNRIKLQMKSDFSLEGRKFVIGEQNHIYTIFDYVYDEKAYSVDEIKENIEMGSFAYFMFDERSCSDGTFQVRVPIKDNYEKINLLFFANDKQVFETVDLKKEKKVIVRV